MEIDAIIEDLPERLSLLKNEETGEGVSRRQVSRAEEKLGIRFPNGFVAFLCKYGWADLEYFALYGLGDDVPKELNLVQHAREEQRATASPIPAYLLPVMKDGAGNHYCLDCRSLDENEECPVVFWDRELGGDRTPEYVGEDYLTWLWDEISEILADD